MVFLFIYFLYNCVAIYHLHCNESCIIVFYFRYTDTFSKPVSGSDESQQLSWFQVFSLSTYKPYFDIDTIDVLDRIKDSLYPFNGAFKEKTSSNPDL